MSLVQEQERSLLSMSKIYLDKAGYENYLKCLEDIKKEIDANAKLMSIYASDDAYGDEVVLITLLMKRLCIRKQNYFKSIIKRKAC